MILECFLLVLKILWLIENLFIVMFYSLQAYCDWYECKSLIVKLVVNYRNECND